GGVTDAGNQGPRRKYNSRVDKGEHDVHRVLGKKHRTPLLDAQALDECNEIIALARPHARRRLIHQQEPGLVGESNRKLDTLDVTIGQFTAPPLPRLAPADLGEEIERAVAMQIRSRPPRAVNLASLPDPRPLPNLSTPP